MTRTAHVLDGLLLAVGVPLALGALTVAIGQDTGDVPGEWRTYNRSLQADRYAPLDQIRPSNVPGLKPVCVYDLNVEASFQTGPIVVGGTLYATTDREVVAIDAGTCALKWRVREAPLHVVEAEREPTVASPTSTDACFAACPRVT